MRCWVADVVVTELVDGIFIGGSINHVVANGTSFWRFMAAWSEIFRSNNTSRVFKRTPIEGFDSIINLSYTHHDQFIERLQSPHELQQKFFHFSSSSISKLKAKANAECNTHNISSLQAVSVLLWRCITRSRRLTLEAETVCKLATSNRHRMSPPLPDDYFGNPVQLVRGTATVAELMSRGLGWAALRLHDAVRKHDDTAVREWVRSWSKAPAIMKMSGVFGPNSVSIGSSPRFDMYGCEFGLGKAVAARSGCANKADGKITMFPGREGGGSMSTVTSSFASEKVFIHGLLDLRSQPSPIHGSAPDIVGQLMSHSRLHLSYKINNVETLELEFGEDGLEGVVWGWAREINVISAKNNERLLELSTIYLLEKILV
ncbi:hypothetical protein L1987_69448 [Smallanthus sonchifolius]|uniref:Uncharacterized protein n=1 Tax=Smallanthus sonchifolius TaxID=185202 RepID=A0ACB9B637_9ASTR|nr:hypothetical protein L1987_69448 [Smallanthus sonchifolius]